jgi:hypothetical protein
VRGEREKERKSDTHSTSRFFFETLFLTKGAFVMSKFQRPADLAFPLVYRTFTARDGENCESVEYRIQDLLESDYERAVELMARDFASEESLCLCRGVCDDAEALEEIKSSWRRGLAGRISVGCYDNRDELVGVTILAVHEKGFGEGAAEVSLKFP